MATKSNRLVPARAIHPGEILREELRERGIKQKEFSALIGMQASHLNDFIKGRRNLNGELAMKLEKYLGIPFKTWMSLQSGYEYDCRLINEKKDEEQEAGNFEVACSGVLNLKILYKYLHISRLSLCQRVKKLKEIIPFDLQSAEDRRLHVAGLYKHSEKVQADDKNMLSWLVLNWVATSHSIVGGTYVKGNAIKAAKDIAAMANHRNMSVNSIKKCLDGYGIAYVEMEKIEKAPIDGYSTFANGHPCITVTYRYNDLDKLAFDIIHELYHIDCHLSDGQNDFIAIEGSEYSNDPKEKEANAFARQTLIPDDIWKHIMSKGSHNLSPYAIVKVIANESKKYGISPSIAVSRYKHDTGWYRTASYKSPKIH